MDAHALNQLLWTIDPMRTGCNLEPGMEDEYGSQARDIAQALAEGQDARSAVMAVFDYYFWEGCLNDRPAALERIVSALQTTA